MCQKNLYIYMNPNNTLISLFISFQSVLSSISILIVWSESVVFVVMNTPSNFNKIDTDGARDFLKRHEWPTGIQNVCIQNMAKIPVRFMIIDDSGSMAAKDGHRRRVKDNGKIKYDTCSRWEELADVVKFQAGLSEAAGAYTEFRLLNSGDPVVVGLEPDPNILIADDLYNRLITTVPTGGTPLCRHVAAVARQIRKMEPALKASGQKASLIICTDGEPSDGDVAEALGLLYEMPVWVVICLCTDDQAIVNYWNNIDRNLELDLEILDDFISEAKEIANYNDWFTYGEPLHRLRQFGVCIKELDLLDECSLTVDQIRDVSGSVLYCAVLRGAVLLYCALLLL